MELMFIKRTQGFLLVGVHVVVMISNVRRERTGFFIVSPVPSVHESGDRRSWSLPGARLIAATVSFSFELHLEW